MRVDEETTEKTTEKHIKLVQDEFRNRNKKGNRMVLKYHIEDEINELEECDLIYLRDILESRLAHTKQMKIGYVII